jgi:dihydrofolate reductase
MIIFGSGSIVSQLTQHGLIDEYQFAVCPVLLGTGQPLIQGVSQRLGLDLLEAKRLPSGDVMLRYVRSTPSRREPPNDARHRPAARCSVRRP